MPLQMSQTLFPRELQHVDAGGHHLFVDPGRPNWVTTNAGGAFLLREMTSPRSVGEVVQSYLEGPAAGAPGGRDQALSFLESAIEAELLGLEARDEPGYAGRSGVLRPSRLEEFWIQINDFCNLTCAHCLVSSSPAAGHGLPAETVRGALQQALDLGVEMVGITGGEPFFRDDLFDLIELVLSDPGRSVTALTNGTRLRGETLETLKRIANRRLELRVSLDGPTAAVNDPIRGQGSFDAAVRGIRNALETECRVTVTMAINGANADTADQMPRIVKQLGIDRLHVLWPFQRGRAIEEGQDRSLTPSVERLIEGYRRLRAAAAAEGVTFFTYESWKVRIDGAPGLKYDLANHCWSSLCLNTDGRVYPSPALSQHPELALGDVRSRPLRELWLGSEVADRFRNATLLERPQCRDCHYRFLCGGGDVDHIYNTSRIGHEQGGNLLADDPYCALYKEILADATAEWSAAAERKRTGNGDPDAPRIVRRMGHKPNKEPLRLTREQPTLATLPST